MNPKSWSPAGLPRFVCSWLCLCLILLMVVPSNAGLKPKVFAKALSDCFFSNPDPPLSGVSDQETQKEMRHNAIRMAFNEDVNKIFKGNYEGTSDTDLFQFGACVNERSKVTLSDIHEQEFKGDETQKALRKAIGCSADSTFDVTRLQKAYSFGAGPTAGKVLTTDEIQAVTAAVHTCFAGRRPNKEPHDLLMRHFFCTNSNGPYFFTAKDKTSKDLTQQVLNYAKCVLTKANGETLPDKIPKELIASPIASDFSTENIQIRLQVLQSTMQSSGHFGTRFDPAKFAKFVKAKATEIGIQSS